MPAQQHATRDSIKDLQRKLAAYERVLHELKLMTTFHT
jgi:hypothetical protein